MDEVKIPDGLPPGWVDDALPGACHRERERDMIVLMAPAQRYHELWGVTVLSPVGATPEQERDVRRRIAWALASWPVKATT